MEDIYSEQIQILVNWRHIKAHYKALMEQFTDKGISSWQWTLILSYDLGAKLGIGTGKKIRFDFTEVEVEVREKNYHLTNNLGFVFRVSLKHRDLDESKYTEDA